MANLLVENKADSEAQTKDGSAVLSNAAKEGHISIVEFMVNRGARLRSRDKMALGLQLIRAVEGGDIALMKRLLIYDAATNATDKSGRTPLLVAFGKRQFEAGAVLASRGVSQAEKEELEKLLMAACENNKIEDAKFLLDCGADVDTRDCFNETPLWKAAIKGFVTLAKLLLERKACIEVKSRNCCRTPVVIAIDRNLFSKCWRHDMQHTLHSTPPPSVA